MASFLFFQSLEPSSGTNRTSLRAQEFPLPRSRTLWNLKPKRFYLFHEVNNHHTWQYNQNSTFTKSCGTKLCVISGSTSGYLLILCVYLTIDYTFLHMSKNVHVVSANSLMGSVLTYNTGAFGWSEFKSRLAVLSQYCLPPCFLSIYTVLS